MCQLQRTRSREDGEEAALSPTVTSNSSLRERKKIESAASLLLLLPLEAKRATHSRSAK